MNVSGPNGQSLAIEIFHRAGGLCQKVFDGDGRAHLVPLARVGRERRKNSDGTIRDYVIYKVPSRRQLLNLLGHAVRVNCYAASRPRRRRPAKAA